MKTLLAPRRLHAVAAAVALVIIIAGSTVTSAPRRAQSAPRVQADAAIIYNTGTGKPIWANDADERRPIGGLTFIMTALSVLDERPDLDREVVVVDADLRWASATTLKAGDRVAVFDLLNLLLVGSDDGAARVLWRQAAGGRSAFVTRMNRKADSLGLKDTHFVDPVGVDPANVSSAHDVARLVTAASAQKMIASALRVVDFSYASNRGALSVRSLNRLLPDASFEVLADKSAFNPQAGYSLAALVRIRGGRAPVAIVVLGAKSNADRLGEARKLVGWAGARQTARR